MLSWSQTGPKLVANLLASWNLAHHALSSLLAGPRPASVQVCELDSVMEFG